MLQTTIYIYIFFFFFFFQKKKFLFHVSREAGFTWNLKLTFTEKNKKCLLLQLWLALEALIT